MKPNTLLISADGTYPGIVLPAKPHLDERFCYVKWYKWGYASSDYMESVELNVSLEHLVKTPEQVRAKFGALPPEYIDWYEIDRRDAIVRAKFAEQNRVDEILRRMFADYEVEPEDGLISEIRNLVLGYKK